MAGLIVACLYWSSSVLAQESVDTATGAESVSNESLSQAEAATERLAQERLAELSRLLSEQERFIEDLQSDYSVYAPELMEAYFDLGALYLEMGEPENAIRVYNNALQVARINTGLYSEEQLPYINSLLTSHASMQDWQAVDDLHHLRLLTHDRLYDITDERYLTAVELFGEWKLRMLRQGLLRQSTRGQIDTAEELLGLYDRVLAAADEADAVAQTKVASMVFGKTQADLTLARMIAETPYTAFAGTVPAYVSQTRCRNVPNAQGQLVRECYEVRVENPRYRQSQRQAKRMALMRHSGEIADGIARLESIRDLQDAPFSEEERTWLEGRIEELQTASAELQQSTRRMSLF